MLVNFQRIHTSYQIRTKRLTKTTKPNSVPSSKASTPHSFVNLIVHVFSTSTLFPVKPTRRSWILFTSGGGRVFGGLNSRVSPFPKSKLSRVSVSITFASWSSVTNWAVVIVTGIPLSGLQVWSGLYCEYCIVSI